VTNVVEYLYLMLSMKQAFRIIRAWTMSKSHYLDISAQTVNLVSSFNYTI